MSGRGSHQLPPEELNHGDSSIIVLVSGIPEVPTYWWWGRGRGVVVVFNKQ